MLEKIMAIATSKDLEALYEQGIIFLILLASSILVYILITYLKPKYQKRAITQYKNNIYTHILDKNIANFNKHNTSTYISALTNDVTKIEENYLDGISFATSICVFPSKNLLVKISLSLSFSFSILSVLYTLSIGLLIIKSFAISETFSNFASRKILLHNDGKE